jgi:hypothetical protein
MLALSSLEPLPLCHASGEALGNLEYSGLMRVRCSLCRVICMGPTGCLELDENTFQGQSTT